LNLGVFLGGSWGGMGVHEWIDKGGGLVGGEVQKL